MRTKEIYFSSLPIDIEILKVSLDWAITTVVPMRLQHAADEGCYASEYLEKQNENKNAKN
jgi:hypothetical protein